MPGQTASAWGCPGRVMAAGSWPVPPAPARARMAQPYRNKPQLPFVVIAGDPNCRGIPRPYGLSKTIPSRASSCSSPTFILTLCAFQCPLLLHLRSVPSQYPHHHYSQKQTNEIPVAMPRLPFLAFSSHLSHPFHNTSALSASISLHTPPLKGSPSWLRFWLIIINMGNNCHWLKMTPICHAAADSQTQIHPFSYLYSTYHHGHFTLNNHWELFVRLKTSRFGLFFFFFLFFSSRGLPGKCCYSPTLLGPSQALLSTQISLTM